jgi:ectoine hydroxylase-related dioxygenase (phytanoyl-CoA dioxygenase family)
MQPFTLKLDQIKSRGFALVPGLLTSAQAAEMRSLLQTYVDEDLQKWAGRDDYPDRWMVHNLMFRSLPFARLLEHAEMHTYLSALLGDTCVLYACTSSSLPPRGANMSNRVHVDCPRVIPGYITNVGGTFALDEFTEANGATYFLPGSTERLTAPSEQEFLAHAERVFPKAGDAVIFNARTWHMGGVNRTERARHGFAFQACRSFMRHRFDYPRMVPAEILATLGETGRRFLGFNVRVPTSLDEYYLPPDQRLYKSNQG